MQPIPTTFVAYVEDKPGVLNRVVSLLRRRNFNIISLNVGRTHEAGVSRMTMVISCDTDTGRRIEANLYKLVNVLRVDNLSNQPSIDRALALIKVAVTPGKRAEVLQLCEAFRGRTVHVGAESIIVEASGPQSEVDSLVEVLRPYGLLEMVQTGTVSMARNTKIQDND
ncbi:MAG: acetolactate synthase-1/3 small subunit [Myxococcota bacterium]|jgi:acetolactate synthase-1/3 small subunit